jgi:hypothetical protein
VALLTGDAEAAGGAEPGVFATLRGGAAVAARGWRLLAALYGVNLLLAAVTSAAPLSARLGAVLDHSLASAPLARGLDLYALFDVLSRTEGDGHPTLDLPILARTSPAVSGALVAGLLFFGLTLFLDGGVLARYRKDGPLAAPAFFGACGASFSRFARIFAWSFPVLGALAFLGSEARGLSVRWMAGAAHEHLGFYLAFAIAPVLLALFLAVRLWFDLAKLRAVAEDEPVARRAVTGALRLLAGSFGRLYAVQVLIALAGLAGMALGIAAWTLLIPAEDVAVAFVAGQAIAVLGVGVRLWQRAAQVHWYEATRVRRGR